MKEHSTIAIRKWDWLLILGTTFAPMTLLRIWKIGPGEVMCFLWSLKYLQTREIKLTFVLRFFLLFYSAMLIGAFICQYVAPDELRSVDLYTWLYLAVIASVAYRYFSDASFEYCAKILFLLSITATLWFFGLYFYSIYRSKIIYNIPLWYHNYRYTGGANNPHQLAALNCALIFSFAYFLIRREKMIISIAGIIANGIMLIATKSSTGYLSVFIGTMVIAVCLISSFTSDKRQRYASLVGLFGLVVILCIFFSRQIYMVAYEWIQSDDNGVGRLELFSNIGVTFSQSPIFGLGPGTHSIYNQEYHNSYLEILAAGGIIGISALIWSSIVLFRKILKARFLIPIVVALYAYGLAGFVMRRIIFWVLIAIVCGMAEKYVAISEL